MRWWRPREWRVPASRSEVRPWLNERMFVLATALTFAVFAGVVRTQLTQVHSKLQLLGYAVAGALVELLLMPRLGRKSSWRAWALYVVAATAAIVAVKWWLEGLHWKQFLLHPYKVVLIWWRHRHLQH